MWIKPLCRSAGLKPYCFEANDMGADPLMPLYGELRILCYIPYYNKHFNVMTLLLRGYLRNLPFVLHMGQCQIAPRAASAQHALKCLSVKRKTILGVSANVCELEENMPSKGLASPTLNVVLRRSRRLKLSCLPSWAGRLEAHGQGPHN